MPRKQEIARVLGPLVCQSPLHVTGHEIQEFVLGDGSGLSTCVPSSVRTALSELGYDTPSSDLAFFEAIGMENLTRGMISLDQALHYLLEQGVDARQPTLAEPVLPNLFGTLSAGGLGVVSYGMHAKLVSGYEYDPEQGLMMRINDPLKNEVELIMASSFVDSVKASRSQFDILLIQPGRT